MKHKQVFICSTTVEVKREIVEFTLLIKTFHSDKQNRCTTLDLSSANLPLSYTCH